ncbi:MAG: N-acetyltransferase, partial [Alphaproteobacteria bacterium]|nr:N-acetyltransferase [Alphaproteobacteria bacterium]
SAHIDHLALKQPTEQGMGPGTGNWGLFDAEDNEVADALITAAEDWLRAKGMHRVLAPISISIWDDPGLLTKGFDHPPVIMMGHAPEKYAGWIAANGYTSEMELASFKVEIGNGLPPIVNRIVESGEKNPRIRIRKVDRKRFKEEADLIIGILNDAWSDNWGFVPITDSEIKYVSKKMKDIIFEDLVRVAEVDGEPVAFMMVWPDINEKLVKYNGALFPFNVIDLLLWLRKPKCKTVRVPLMGVIKRLQASRLASQLAFMLIEHIRRDTVINYGATMGDFGWVLKSNGPMLSVGEAVGGQINKEYTIYEKVL